MSVTINENIASDVQELGLGNLITLYELDATMYGEPDKFYFTEAIDGCCRESGF